MVWNACMYSVLYSAQEDPVLATQESTIINESEKLSIYPNPVKSSVNLIADFGAGRLKGSIIHSSGKVIRRLNTMISPGSKSILIEGMDTLSDGVYFINIEAENGVFRGKFIKTKF